MNSALKILIFKVPLCLAANNCSATRRSLFNVASRTKLSQEMEHECYECCWSRTHYSDYISHLAWEHVRILQEELESIAEKRNMWNTLINLHNKHMLERWKEIAWIMMKICGISNFQLIGDSKLNVWVWVNSVCALRWTGDWWFSCLSLMTAGIDFSTSRDPVLTRCSCCYCVFHCLLFCCCVSGEIFDQCKDTETVGCQIWADEVRVMSEAQRSLWIPTSVLTCGSFW